MTDLSNWSPFTILAGPADVYLAPTGTAFPAVNAAPGGSWTAIGKTEGGVTVRHTQTVNQITADQFTGPVKAIRTEEGLEVNFSLVDMTLENYALVMDGVTVTAAAGPPAIKSVPLHKEVSVDLRAILVRGRSPYGNFPAQYQVPVVYQSESPEVSFVKDDKSVLACVWTALEDLTAGADSERFGKLVAQTS
jgi:hypothetical protein